MKEINRLVSLGVMKRQSSSQWASPIFITPKKNMTVHTISDFRELNKRIVRRPYPIPKISTTLQELEGFTYVTALDLNMGLLQAMVLAGSIPAKMARLAKSLSQE
jgi:hypothetical protein